ncbi:MAG: hypothetical protein PHR06_13535 [Candidatus Cloacimonetes bacterium]|nr:hypothetical protein [Candidatus Cloacimonadota bacterium]
MLVQFFLVVQDSIYAMPTEYNRYVRDRGETITEDNAFEKVEEFIKLWITVPVEIEKIRWKDLNFTGGNKKNNDSRDKCYGGYTYRIEAISYSAEQDIRIKWNIGYFNQKFAEIKVTPLHHGSEIFEEPEGMINIYHH